MKIDEITIQQGPHGTTVMYHWCNRVVFSMDYLPSAYIQIRGLKAQMAVHIT